MSIFLYHFFHNRTNDRTEAGFVSVPPDKHDWPSSWKTISYKKYDVFREILLPRNGGGFFDRILNRRRSSEGYILGNVLTVDILSYVLRCGYGLQSAVEGETRTEHRTVPSGGKLYPLEIYVFFFKQIGEIEPGIYHYGIRNHALEPVVLKFFTKQDISAFTPIRWLEELSCMICISGVFERMTDKYGSRGYRYILLEAGHVAQNMLLAGTEQGVNILPVGGVNEGPIERAIGLNETKERIVYSLFL
jgi:SagB-type dehydrogenase family enzyme